MIRKIKKRNSAPEKHFQRKFSDYLEDHGFYVIQCESKSIKTISRGKTFWRNAGLAPGVSDLLAISPLGIFMALELKAKGRLKTLRPKQRDFLINVIHNNGFGACLDSIERFQTIYNGWIQHRDKEAYLMEMLPESSLELDPDSALSL